MKHKLLNLKSLLLLMLMCISMGAWAEEVKDVIAYSSLKANSNTYAEFKNVEFSSSAVYAGVTARAGSASKGYCIQINDASKSFIETTESGGKVKSISVKWASSATNTSDRYIIVKGQDKAYSYSSNNFPGKNKATGTEIGKIVYKENETSASISSITSDYRYIFLEASGAMYIDEISIVWDTTSDSGDTSVTEQYSYTLETIGQGNVVFNDANNNAIAPNQKVNKDTKLTPTFSPAEGYKFTSWEYYSSVGEWKPVSGDVFTITKDVQFRVTFTETQQGGEDGDDEDRGNLTVTYNFNDKDAYPTGFPTSKPSSSNSENSDLFSIGGNDLYIQASSGEYFYVINYGTDASRGLFFGKTTAANGKPTDGTAYIGFPAKQGYKLVKVVATTTAGVAGSVKMNIYDEAWNAYSTELTTTTTTKKEFTFNLSGTEANTEYRLASGSSGKNLQFDNIVLTYEKVEPTIPTFASLDELINANLKEPTVVNVTLTEEVVEMAMTHPMLPGMYIVVLNGDKATIAAPGADLSWVKGGLVSGTLENVTWNPDELSLSSEDGETFWSSLSYTAPAGAPQESITIYKACNDGELYYTTYSSANAFYVPNDLIVYEVLVEGNEIAPEPYETGSLVPPYTGVLVCSDDFGTFYVDVETDYDMIDEFAESVLGEYNALRPTCFPEGITAEDMAAEDPGMMYYRLTMHNGTQCGFWWGAEDGKAFNIAPNKAYLVADPTAAQANAKGFTLKDIVNAVNNAKTEKTNSEVRYNLNGQRVNANAKGIIIVNGKKIVKK